MIDNHSTPPIHKVLGNLGYAIVATVAISFAASETVPARSERANEIRVGNATGNPAYVEAKMTTLAPHRTIAQAPPEISKEDRVRYETYYNDRFNYSVDYPENMLIPQGEPTNGDGQEFVSESGNIEMMVYGYHDIFDKTLEDLYRQTIREGMEGEPGNLEVTYQRLGDNWFVVSGYQNGQVFYHKRIRSDGDIKVLEIQYDRSLQPQFDRIVADIANSFQG
ncbi:hypothetical protein [Phormidium sp. CCY1219]|uniref:hypothetical protein n=1 Tax=Phormidium sp. CCY1219 TaxID=2886104 RepID=UPI002D1E79C7|nr:hypothetical protein [Phormidium sp. CCY1219]MEB3828217.1 hypothetical protein [Phormidium sp. CCY1219]